MRCVCHQDTTRTRDQFLCARKRQQPFCCQLSDRCPLRYLELLSGVAVERHLHQPVGAPGLEVHEARSTVLRQPSMFRQLPFPNESWLVTAPSCAAKAPACSWVMPCYDIVWAFTQEHRLGCGALAGPPKISLAVASLRSSVSHRHR
jgi:hypothetical protein